MTRTWIVISDTGRLFLEAWNGMPGARLTIVSDTVPASVASMSFSVEDLSDLRSTLNLVEEAMREPYKADGR